jgi:hypothetical protein
MFAKRHGSLSETMAMTTLTQRADNLWTADHELTMPGGVPLPTRMTVVRLEDGALALISPVPLDDALARELARLGQVSHLIAPNLLHHLHLGPAAQRYPEAKVMGPAGLAAKKPGLGILPIEFENGALGGVLSAITVDGAPKFGETAFFHAPSRSLIVADLVFNVERPPSWKTAMMLWTTGTRGKLAQSRLWSFAVADRPAAAASSQRILAWDFDRLIVAHGEVIPTGAKDRVAAAMTRTRAV